MGAQAGLKPVWLKWSPGRTGLSRATLAAMPPGGGVGITSINRETKLPELIAEVQKRAHDGAPQLGKATMDDPKLVKGRDAAMRASRPHLFYDSQKHIDKVKQLQSSGQGWSPKLKPSMSAPSVSTICKSAAGSSTFMDLLKKQYGIVG